LSVSAKASIRLKFENKKQLATLLIALTPETQTMQVTRANVKLCSDGDFLVFSVEGEDTVALRATLNAYLRWIQSIINVLGTLNTPKLPEDSATKSLSP
jgi:tRNA threonylcarbamoyladenosine modification (KEOPS) complex  Pcc1 subunit